MLYLVSFSTVLQSFQCNTNQFFTFSSSMPAALWSWLCLPSNPSGDVHWRELRTCEAFLLRLSTCGCACLLSEWGGWGRLREVLHDLGSSSWLCWSRSNSKLARQSDRPHREQHTLWQWRQLHLNPEPQGRPPGHQLLQRDFSLSWISVPALCSYEWQQVDSAWWKIQMQSQAGPEHLDGYQVEVGGKSKSVHTKLFLCLHSPTGQRLLLCFWRGGNPQQGHCC